MGQTTNQIEAHIDNVREDLGSNIYELERKVKSVTDWRQHFNTSPITMLGVAFGGGVLAAAMLGGRRADEHPVTFRPLNPTPAHSVRRIKLWKLGTT